MVLAQKQTYRSMKQNREPRNKPTHLSSVHLRQGRQKYTMEQRVSPTNGIGKVGQFNVNQWKLEHAIIAYAKIYSKWHKGLNIYEA